MQKVKDILAAVREKYNIHNRPFTITDFYRICYYERIEVAKRCFPSPLLGMYLKSNGKRFIFLNIFGKNETLITAFHELGHHFLHHNKRSKHYFKKNTQSLLTQEKEAELFAELATGQKSQIYNYD